MDLLSFFLAQHADSHAAALTGADEPQFSDQVLAGMTGAQLRLRPAPGLNSIAWLLWHIARCEDVAIRVLLTDCGQILDEGNWLPQLGITQRDMGTGMDAAGVTTISARLDIGATIAYRNAVGRRTREAVSGLSGPAWEGPIEPERLLEADAFPNHADGMRRVATYWRDKTRSYLLTSSIATHNYQHLGEATVIKGLIGRMG